LSQAKTTDKSLEMQDLTGMAEAEFFGSTIDPNSTARNNSSMKIISPKNYNENGEEKNRKF